MTKVSSSPGGALAGASVDLASDLIPIIDMSETGTDRNCWIVPNELFLALRELFDDRMDAVLTEGSNIALTYDDGAGTITIDATTPAPGDITGLNEAIDDRVAALLQEGTGITLTYNDGAGTLIIDGSAGSGYTPGGTDVAVADGGTGASDAAGARANLGAAASGAATASGITTGSGTLLGRTTASSGAIEEISAGAGITLTGGVLSASGAGGGGAASWANVGSWTWSTNVAEVTFTGLSAYNELMVIIRGVTTSVSGVRRVQVGVDNGSSYFSGASDYLKVSDIGVEANADTPGIAYHSSNSAAARTLVAHILNTRGNVKVGEMNNATSSASRILFVGSTSDINAIRIDNHTGGNLTGGSILLLGR